MSRVNVSDCAPLNSRRPPTHETVTSGVFSTKSRSKQQEKSSVCSILHKINFVKYSTGHLVNMEKWLKLLCFLFV